MKKMVVVVLAFLMAVVTATACSAFPAPGQYVSAERAIATDTRQVMPEVPLWRVEIRRTREVYQGAVHLIEKGAWTGDWSVPATIKPNDRGRYVLEASDHLPRWGMTMVFEVEETSASSFNMYRVSPTDGSIRLVGTMRKAE